MNIQALPTRALTLLLLPWTALACGGDGSGNGTTDPDESPTISISSPAAATTVSEGNPVLLTASATDPEDGNLSGQIAWSSNLDGALGTGGSIQPSLSVGTHTVTASVQDSEGKSASATVQVTVDAAPSIAITDPPDAAVMAEDSDITFTATASDPEDGDLSGAVSWSSNLDGALGTGGSVTVRLTAGDHTVTAEVSDVVGATATASIAITVQPNQAPTLRIASGPTEGSTLAEGSETVLFLFSAAAEDAEDGTLTTSIEWTSDVDGVLGTGQHLQGALSVGPHVVVASVEDSGGLVAADTVRVTVIPFGAVALGPDELVLNFDLTTFGEGPPFNSIGFQAFFAEADPVTGADQVEVARYGGPGATDLIVRSDVTEWVTEDGTTYGPSITANPIYEPMMDGTFSWGIRMTSGTATLAGLVACGNLQDSGRRDCLTLTSGQTLSPPVVDITAPANGTTVGPGTLITLSAGATDAEDGDLSSAVVWSSNLDGSLGTGASLDVTLSPGVHTVLAGVTDSHGSSASDTVQVVVSSPPTVTILGTRTQETVFVEGSTVSPIAQASDPEDGDLSDAIVWTSDLDGALGTGVTVDAVLSVGTHAIAASVTDSDGNSAADTLSILVDGAPTALVTQPANGTVVLEGAVIPFVGTASDPEEGDLSSELVWTSSVDGALGTGSTVDATLGVGSHAVVAGVVDSLGQYAADTVAVVVEASSACRTARWTNAAGGSWTEGSNWNVGTPPLATDCAVIDLPGTYVVEFPVLATDTVAALIVGGASGRQELRLRSDATLQVDSAGLIRGSGAMEVGGQATYGGAADLEVEGELELNGGALSGPSMTRIAPDGVLFILGSGVIGDDHLLRNEGSWSWPNGRLQLVGSARAENAAAGTLQTSGGSVVAVSSMGARFDNGGTIEYDGAAASFVFEVPMNNTGSVVASAGTLAALGGGTATGGSFTADASAVLRFGGAYLADATSSITGPGRISMHLGSTPGPVALTVQGTYDVGTTLVRVGGLDVQAASIITDSLIFQPFNSDPFIQGTGTVETTDLTWHQGQLLGATVNVAGHASFETGGDRKLLDAATVNLNGTGTWSGGPIVLNNGAVIRNAASSTFEIQSGQNLGPTASSGAGSPGRFINEGSVVRQVGDAESGFRVPFDNLGSVSVVEGRLTVEGGGTSTGGTFAVASGAELQFGGSYVADAASSITGAGRILIRNEGIPGPVALTVQGTYEVGTTVVRVGGLDVQAASIATDSLIFNPFNSDPFIQGTGTVEAVDLTWHQGQLLGATLNVAGHAAFETASGRKLLDAATLNLNGTGTWSAGPIVLNNGALMNNAGVLTVAPIQPTMGSASTGFFISGGTLEFQLADSSDGGAIEFGSGVGATISGAALMTPLAGYTPTGGDAFQVLASPAGAISGGFSGVNSGWTITSTTTTGIIITRN